MSQETVKDTFNFIWAIENFSHALEQKEEMIESPVFKVADSDDTGWCVRLYPRSRTGESIGLYLLPKNFNRDRNISTISVLSLLSADGKILESKKGNFRFRMKNQNYIASGWSAFLSREYLLEKKRTYFLPEGTLTVCCCIQSIDSKQVDSGSCFARSRISVQKTSFIWRIQNFSKFQPKQKASILAESVSTQVDLFFPSEALEYENLQIEISELDISSKNLSICKLSLLDVNGQTVDFKKDEHLFEENKNDSWNFPQFITRGMLLSKRSLYLPRDVLTLRCDLAVSVGVISNEIEMYGEHLNQTVKSIDTIALDNLRLFKRKHKSDHSHTLMKDLKQLYKDQIHSDMSLRVGSSTFPIHKNILSARSSVFRVMFEKDMLENNTGAVIIPDLDQETVCRMLIFLYTDAIEDLQWKDAINLYTAADKYDIPRLREEYCSVLVSSVNESNVVELLTFANMHSDDSLKICAQDFMLGREKKIFASDEWNIFITNNGVFAAKIMQYLFLKK